MDSKPSSGISGYLPKLYPDMNLNTADTVKHEVRDPEIRKGDERKEATPSPSTTFSETKVDRPSSAGGISSGSGNMFNPSFSYFFIDLKYFCNSLCSRFCKKIMC